MIFGPHPTFDLGCWMKLQAATGVCFKHAHFYSPSPFTALKLWEVRSSDDIRPVAEEAPPAWSGTVCAVWFV